MKGFVNVGRAKSGGAFNGLFGNPVYERAVSAQYEKHFIKVIANHPEEIKWLQDRIAMGAVLFCPGCGVGSKTCHARVIELQLLLLTF